MTRNGPPPQRSRKRRIRPTAGIPATGLAIAFLLFPATTPSLSGQGLPAPVYSELLAAGHPKLARKLSEMLELRSHPDSADVQRILERWELEAGGPQSPYDHLAVTRLWLKAGQVSEAELSLRGAIPGVPPGLALLDQARIGYLGRDYAIADAAYWKGCELADQAASIEYWLDLEALATPEEVANWERFVTLPVNERNLCNLLRVFWNRRAAASLVTVTQRVTQHYQRLYHARQWYLRRSNKKGPTFSNRIGRPVNSVFDDRGLLYLRMGEPDRKTSFLSGECYDSNESWAYYYPEGTQMYHLTSGIGVDDWWLIDSLSRVYVCGSPGTHDFGRGPLSPLNTVGGNIPGTALRPVYNELYASRGGLDPLYQQMAYRMRPGNPVTFQEQFGRERLLTYAAAELAIDSVPERPNVDPKARLLIEDLQFRGANQRTRVWLNGVIEAKKLLADSLPEGGFQYRVEAVYSLLDARDDLVQGVQLFETTSDELLGEDESIPVRIPLELVPGQYRYTIMVRSTRREEGAQEPVGNYHRAVLTVHQYDATVPQLSSIAVAPDSGGDWSAGGGVHLKPSPAHNTGSDRIAHVYYQVYGLTPSGEYVTTVHMDPEGVGEDFTLEFTGVASPNPAAPTHGYLRLDLRDTPPGVYKMSVSVEDRATLLETLPLPLDILVNKPD